MRAPDCRGACAGLTRVQNLAGLDQILYGAGHFLYGHRRVDAVLVQEIDTVGAQTTQQLVAHPLGLIAKCSEQVAESNVAVYEGRDEQTGTHYFMSTDPHCSWCFLHDDYVDDDAMTKANRRIITEELCPLLEEGEMLVLMEAGSQDTRYVTAYAGAFAWDGRHCRLSLGDIYNYAAEAFGVDKRAITAAVS
jgi:hypothetical protein